MVAQCGICGKPICVVCTKLYGYFCSDRCKLKAKSRSPASGEGAKMAVFGSRLMRVGRWFTLIVVPIVALATGIYVIYQVTSKEGLIVWTFEPEKDRPFNGILAHGDMLIASCDQVCLYGIDKNTGRVLWGFDGGRGIAHTPPQLAGDLCLTSDYEYLYGVSATDGKEVWKHRLPENQNPTPVAGKKCVAYLYQRMRKRTDEERLKIRGPILTNFVPAGSTICVVDIENGSVLWEKELKKSFYAGGKLAMGPDTIYYATHTTEDEVEETPEPDDGKEPKKPAANPVIGSEDLTTKFTVTAYDALSKRGKWKAVLEGGTGYTIRVQAIPKGVLVTTGSNVYALAEANGRPRWKHPIKKVGYLFWGPTVAGDLVFLPDNNLLLCLDLETGKELWRHQPQGDDDPSEPQLVDDVVFLTAYVQEKRQIGTAEGIHTYRAPGTEDLVPGVGKNKPRTITVSVGTLLALDAKTGKQKWQLRDVGSKLVYGNNQLITLRYHALASTTRTRVTAINPNTGSKLWDTMYIGNISDGFTDGKRFYMVANSGVQRFTPSSRQPPNSNVIEAYSIGR
jgi:outer membrane protein assembly factor BamB